jgi:exosortase A-associated hydrolase 1
MTAMADQALVFDCDHDTMVGILHRPVLEQRPVGVVIVVGGPQYRAGSHRQFVLTARALAAAGYPVLRFDYRGMGDSSGTPRTFEQVSADIRAAVDALLQQVPRLDGVVLWGLCDAASAAMMYCSTDPRVRGVVVANPWVRSTEGEAKAYIKHYYGNRLLQRSFWLKVLRGEFNVMRSARDFVSTALRSRTATGTRAAPQTFHERMLAGLTNFAGPILLLISERDLTAQEFEDLCSANPRWRAAATRASVTRQRLPDADHTFAVRRHLDLANRVAVDWLDQCGASMSRDIGVTASQPRRA